MPDNNLNDTVGGNNLSTFSLRSPLKSELNLRSKETQRDDQFSKIYKRFLILIYKFAGTCD